MIPEITFLGRTLPIYGLFCTLGIVVACVVGLLLAKKKGFEIFDFVLVALITLISAFVGAKLLAIIVEWNAVVATFQAMPFFEAFGLIMMGGFVFYGGLIGGVVGLFTTLIIKKADILSYTNIYCTVLPLGHAFCRIGCFFGGCCHGKIHDGFLSVTYGEAYEGITTAPLNTPVLATQLIEATALFVISFVLLFLFFKFPKTKKLTTIVYAFSYSIVRFVLEFFRGDSSRGIWANISTSQWISIIIFACVLAYTIYCIVKYHQSKKLKLAKVYCESPDTCANITETILQNKAQDNDEKVAELKQTIEDEKEKDQ